MNRTIHCIGSDFELEITTEDYLKELQRMDWHYTYSENVDEIIMYFQMEAKLKKLAATNPILKDLFDVERKKYFE